MQCGTNSEQDSEASSVRDTVQYVPMQCMLLLLLLLRWFFADRECNARANSGVGSGGPRGWEMVGIGRKKGGRRGKA